MKTLTKLLFLMAFLVLATACKKEIETVMVPTDKVYSWMPLRQVWGNQTTILGMTTGINTVNVQTVGRFEVVSPLPGSKEQVQNGYYTGLNHLSRTWFSDPTPFDVRNRIPMNTNFYANPGGYRDISSDTVLTIYPTSYLDNPAYLHLHKLDPHAVQFENHLVGSMHPFGAINRNDYLLCSYYTDNPAANTGFNLVLSKLSTGPLPVPSPGPAKPKTLISSRVIRVPTLGPSERDFKEFWAIDDYFLVWCNYAGLYKVWQDGTVKQINGPPNFTSGPVAPTTIYKWKGTVYSIQQGSGGNATFYTSTNDGESWQQISGFNQGLIFSTFYPVGDSLVGITHGIITNSIYTLRWLNANTIRLREVKNDGLGYADFADLAQLGDTVYLGTTSGLFKRPLSIFFESKQK